MWTRTFSKFYSGVSAQTIWKIWTDVNNWTNWHDDLDYCKLKGDFAVGNYFILKPKGVRPVKIFFTEINEGESFTDCTSFLGAKMYDTHSVVEKDGGVELTNKLVVVGPLKWLWIMLVANNVAKTVPEETNALVRVAKSSAVTY